MLGFVYIYLFKNKTKKITKSQLTLFPASAVMCHFAGQ